MRRSARAFARVNLAALLAVAAAGLVALACLAFAQEDMGPGMGPDMGPGAGPEMGPGMGSDGGPGMGPDRDPGMGPGMGPDGGPGMGPDGGPGMGPGKDREMDPGRRSEMDSDAADERTIRVHGVERSYTVHIPPKPQDPAPLVFVFHGCGGRPAAIERRTGMDALSDRYGFITVYPAGMGWGSSQRGTWNVGGGDSPSTSDGVALVKAILHQLESKGPIDRNRIYATGHSMGGVFAYKLACEMSDTFAAIAAVSATMVERGCHPSSPVAVLHIHGTDDDRIPLAGGRGERTARDRQWPTPQKAVAAWSAFDGCHGQSGRRDVGGDTCTSYAECRAPVEFCIVPGGGHTWPEDASDRIWAFFAAHPKAS